MRHHPSTSSLGFADAKPKGAAFEQEPVLLFDAYEIPSPDPG